MPDDYDNPIAEQNSAIDNNYYLECELTKGATYVYAPYDPEGYSFTEAIIVERKHRISTEQVGHMKISPEKDAAYHSESVKVTVQTEGAYSPKVFVKKTSSGSCCQ